MNKVAATLAIMQMLLVTQSKASADEGELTAGKKLHTLRAIKRHMIGHHAGYTVDITYPQFKSQPSQVAIALNRRVKQLVNSSIYDLPPSGKSRYEYTCDYQIRTVSPEAISVMFRFYRYVGGAHGIANYRAFNYKLAETATPVKLKDVLRYDVDYQKLSKLIKRQLPFADASVHVDDSSPFAFTEQGIIFPAGNYQLQGDPAGCRDIFITYSAIKRMRR